MKISNYLPLASISMDLDNQWSYMKTHGENGWQKYPSYFNILIPYILNILESYDLKITPFYKRLIRAGGLINLSSKVPGEESNGKDVVSIDRFIRCGYGDV